MQSLPKILVIDDDETDRVALRRCLGAAGIGAIIDELDDGDEVVARIATNRYDCIVLDHRLPGETAFDVIARIRSAAIPTPILCVSGHEDDLGTALVAAGATAFLPKSQLSPPVLALHLRDALHSGLPPDPASDDHDE